MKARYHISLRLVLFVLAGAALVMAVHLALFISRPASTAKEFKEVLIPEGATFRSVAAELKREGIITDKETFIIIARLKGVDRKVRAGFYSLDTGMRPLEVLDVIEKGRIIEYQVVLPEGFDIMKAADAVEKAGLATRAEFMAKAADPAYVRSLGLEGGTLEGYLFPATYFFPKGTSLDGMIKQMVGKYREVFTDELKARAAELGMTERQALILASLVEREAAIDSERMLISAVFHNRLKRGMRLQCDSTVIYYLQFKGGWNGDITKADLRRKDPYNTYAVKGLPPGPISNPGKPSIIAALYPADVDYLFFVSRNDGTHFFSSNLSQHNRAVQEYQVLPNITGVVKAKG
ncbi:MAG: endolytic transglycosylase MltG [Nitrospirae bacterium]|nr:endolytic transglycosylase MltG [Nitrospirota bacterium]MBI5696800.1 endolytic transglycosylase MltG [Nitrospirota bacterium]